MPYTILFIGDVVGSPGREVLQAGLPHLQERHSPLFTIVNGENAASGVGITPKIADSFYSWGIDAITLGNHAFNRREIGPYLNEGKPIVRPANMAAGTPGKGLTTIEKSGKRLAIANLCGRVFMDGYNDPFEVVETLLKEAGDTPFFLDFHGEATSEKIAMGYHLQGRALAVVGTHTHVATADERILPGGTAVITDVGMTGPVDGVIGMNRDIILARFRTGMPAKFDVAEGPSVISAVSIEVDDSGKAVNIQRDKFGPI